MARKMNRFGQIQPKQLFLFLVLILILTGSPHDTLAQSETSHDLVNAVNELRAFYGFPAYEIDPELMEYAQEHAEYMASIQSGTHQHSDGSLPTARGLVENVASGDQAAVTVAIVVNEIWSDWGHRTTLIGYATGEIGAGVALAENGQVYYCVDVRPGEVVAATNAVNTPIPLNQFMTSTPQEDGAIYHVVRSGETLWKISDSYGIRIEEIRILNGMPADSSLINVGQRLMIRSAQTRTPTPYIKPTQAAPETPTPPHFPETEISSSAMTSSPGDSSSGLDIALSDNNRPIAIMILIVLVAGLILGIFGFIWLVRKRMP